MLVTAEDSVAPGGPALTTTVPKEYVHRAALSEVFLTGWRETGPDAFAVTAQWPRSHSFYVSEHGLYDPLLLCETVRQTFPLLTHAAYGVPLGYQLSWSHFSFAVNPQAMRIEQTPADLELRVVCSDVAYRRSLPGQLSMRLEVVRDGALLAVANTRFGCHSKPVYQRLRAGRADTASIFASVPAPPAVAVPSPTGRDRHQDIVLAATDQPGRWLLRVDSAHPVLFDHPVDHVPGMLLLESARQALHALRPDAATTMPLEMDVAFHRYVEFDDPCWIEAEPVVGQADGAQTSLRVVARQNDTVAFSATVKGGPVPGR